MAAREVSSAASSAIAAGGYRTVSDSGAALRGCAWIALGVPEIVLPRRGTDLQKWAVIACDQYTSEPEYREKVAAIVGDAPSTPHLST